MSMYIVGPTDTKEHERWSSELEQLLAVDIDDLQFRLPVQAAEIVSRLTPVVEKSVGMALSLAAKRQHLERVASLQFSLFMSRPGISGLLTFSYRVYLDPFSVRCTGCDGMLGESAMRPER